MVNKGRALTQNCTYTTQVTVASESILQKQVHKVLVVLQVTTECSKLLL